MPRSSEDSYFTEPSNCCTACGAGLHNNYQHDKNCLINVPVVMVPLWRRGFQAQMKAGWGNKVPLEPLLSEQEGLAFSMGAAAAERQLSSKRTLLSLAQAVEIVKANRGNGDSILELS